MEQRFFRATAENYEALRLQIDAARGLPNEAEGRLTSFDPAATAPRGAQGRVYLATWAFVLESEPFASFLAGGLAAGLVEEVAGADYDAATRPERLP